MPQTATIPLGPLWEETIAFLRAEFALVLPVALLGFALPMTVMLLAVPVDEAESGTLVAGPWMVWFLPAGLLSMMGSLGVSALAVHPGATVGECLRIALARAPSGLGLVLLNFAVQVALGLPALLVNMLEINLAGSAGAFTAVANLAGLAATIWLFVRAMPVWALLAYRPLAPWPAARAVFALTQGQYRKLLLLRVVALFAGMLALLATLVPIGVLFALIGRLTGAAAVTQALSYVATGAVFSGLMALWTIYVARLYVRLAGSSSGI